MTQVAQNLAVMETVMNLRGLHTVRAIFGQPSALSRGWTDGWSRPTASLTYVIVHILGYEIIAV